MNRLAVFCFTLASTCTAASFEPRGSNQFVGHVAGERLLVGDSGALILRHDLRLYLAGSRPGAVGEALGRQPGSTNYFIGSDPKRWRTGLPLYDRIRYSNVYPGIDLIYYGAGTHLEYDFEVAPGASWRPIRLAFSGAWRVRIDRDGDLKIEGRSGSITHRRPRIFQRSGSSRREVAGRYVLTAHHQVRFEIGKYDPALPLIIDPTLVYASYLGGSGDDYGNAIAVDGSGCAYVVGETWSTNFPLAGAHQAMPAGNTDIFVSKWNAEGTALLYSTYLGGSSRDAGLGIAVDPVGHAYITGFTYSPDFPVTTGALSTGFSGLSKAFVTSLSADGSTLAYSTYLGGSGSDYGTGIAVDPAGQAHVSGYTASLDFPVSSKAFQRYYGGGSFDGFLAKLNAAGSALLYATFLGGNGNDTAAAVALDSSGNIYVTGQTQSSNFPIFNAFQTAHHQTDAFIVKMTALGQPFYSTYLGGAGINTGNAVVADSNGNAYISGSTTATDFPVSPPAFQTTNHGGYDGFVAKLGADGSSIVAATYLGGSATEDPSGIALDTLGNIYIAGSTQSIDFPVQGATQSAYGGGGDAFLTVFNNQLSGLYYSTFFGGAEAETATAVAVDPTGAAYLTGFTSSGESSQGLPVTSNTFQPVAGGAIDAFLAKFAGTASSLSCSASTPAPLTIQSNALPQLVADLVLSCTGGALGASAIADIRIDLNTQVAAGTQPELLIDDPSPGAQVANQNLFFGSLSGTASIIFHDVSFAVPGTGGVHTLRITNVQVNALTAPAGGQVVMTATASNATPAIMLAPTPQTVALVQTVTPGLQTWVLSKSAAPPPNGSAPPASSSFMISDPQAMIWFQVNGASAGDVARADWYSPSGTVSRSHTLNAVTAPGTQNFWDTLKIAGASPLAGNWNIKVYWNNGLLFSAPFNISSAGTRQLIWQNSATRQVTVHYFASGPTDVNWAWLNSAGCPGWSVVGLADMDGNGTPDLIWQNNTTRQVTVNYYSQGPLLAGWAWLNSAGAPGWKVVGVADMDRNGTPDLIWQNDTTRQVSVNYYGGPGGSVYQGWAWLNAAGVPGWKVVGVADMDGNGTPDLIWQNDTTRQVTVNYYGGTGGATYQGWANLNSGVPGWTVVNAADFDGNGTPDLVWRNDATSQVTVNFYGGTGGAAYQGWAWLNASGYTGWSAMATE